MIPHSPSAQVASARGLAAVSWSGGKDSCLALAGAPAAAAAPLFLADGSQVPLRARYWPVTASQLKPGEVMKTMGATHGLGSVRNCSMSASPVEVAGKVSV